MVYPRLLLLVLLIGSPARADELRLDAKTLFESAVTRNLRLSPDGSALQIEDGELIEDDGPAAGFSYLPHEEKLAGRVRIRKELIIADPRARTATLLVSRGGDGITIQVNGKAIATKQQRTVGGYWSTYPIPVEALKAGTNTFDLGGTGSVYIARGEDFAAGSLERAKHPRRSARSTNDGQTWQVDQLGPKGDIAGEYCIRLVLDRVCPTATLITPILDLGNLANRPIAPALAKLGSLHIQADGTDGLRLRVRTGPEAAENARSFSPWVPLENLREPTGRYFQVAVDFATNDPLKSPSLKALQITTNPTLVTPDWTKDLKIVRFVNGQTVRSSIPFAYEAFNHPRLKELREHYKLDDIVKDAKNELETITRLARWSAERWERGHLKEMYPAWDALAILMPQADGTPLGGFCQQYNLVFLQACESLGIPGRCVSIGAGDHSAAKGGGHEVVELWSNQFRKWIYVDGNLAWYAADAAADTPLSLLELRDRQLLERAGKAAPATRIVHLRETGKRWNGLTDWPPFLELRMIPRSNFLEAKSPLPLNQGMRGWSWTGHHVWTDAVAPASMIYSQRVHQRRSWEWTLNQVHVHLEATTTPGELSVDLDTSTPHFANYLIRANETAKELAHPVYSWKLGSGKNRFEVRSQNLAGREGPPAIIQMERP